MCTSASAAGAKAQALSPFFVSLVSFSRVFHFFSRLLIDDDDDDITHLQCALSVCLSVCACTISAFFL